MSLKHKIKNWYKSWSINYGLLVSLWGVAAVYVDTLNDPMFTMASGMIIIMLRFKTTQAVQDK